MKHLIKTSSILIAIIIALSACTASKKIPYFKDAGNESIASTGIPEPKIYKNDQITILVNTPTPEASTSFNMMITPSQFSGQSLSMTQNIPIYIVNSEGYIDFPILGKIYVNGKTRKETEEIIKQSIYPKYIKEEPIVNIRFVNFNISVLGEVNKPGSFNITNEKVTILEALAKAGDMTIYGQRENILLIREDENGKKETVRLNLQDIDLLNSQYYYLKQNDVLYVQTNKTKSRSSAVSSVESLTVSITSTLISLTSLLVTIYK